MGGDPIPGPLDPLVEWFEEWKATLPRVKAAPRRRYVSTKPHQPNYLHGNLNRKREAAA